MDRNFMGLFKRSNPGRGPTTLRYHQTFSRPPGDSLKNVVTVKPAPKPNAPGEEVKGNGVEEEEEEVKGKGGEEAKGDADYFPMGRTAYTHWTEPAGSNEGVIVARDHKGHSMSVLLLRDNHMMVHDVAVTAQVRRSISLSPSSQLISLSLSLL